MSKAKRILQFTKHLSYNDNNTLLAHQSERGKKSSGFEFSLMFLCGHQFAQLYEVFWYLIKKSIQILND